MAQKETLGVGERVAGSGAYWIRFRDVAGKRHWEKAGRQGDAIVLLEKRKREALIERKLPELKRSKAVTFDNLCSDALAYSKAENSAKQTYELDLRIKILRTVFGSRPASEIKKQEIVTWLSNRAQENNWKAATRNRWQSTFSLIFRVGVDNERIENNPAARIRRKTENNGRVRFLSDEEEVRLLAAIDQLFPQFKPHVLIALHTGMRMTEEYSLHWNQVDLDRHQLHLSKTKTGKPRIIPLNATATEAFNTLKSASTKPTGLVFPSVRTGMSLQGPRGWFGTAVEAAGIKDFTWYCLRHTTASRLVMGGASLRAVADLLGHKTIQMTMRYAHLAPDHQTEIVALLDKKPSGARATKRATGTKRSNGGRLDVSTSC